MGEVKEFKPRNKPPDEEYVVACGECDNTLLIVYLNGELVCPICETYTTIQDALS